MPSTAPPIPFELVVYGSAAQVKQLIQDRLRSGVRPAPPGEFRVSLDDPTALRPAGAIATGQLEERDDGTTRVVGTVAVSDQVDPLTGVAIPVAMLALSGALLTGSAVIGPVAFGLAVLLGYSFWPKSSANDAVLRLTAVLERR